MVILLPSTVALAWLLYLSRYGNVSSCMSVSISICLASIRNVLSTGKGYFKLVNYLALGLLIGNFSGVIPVCIGPTSQALVCMGLAMVLMIGVLVSSLAKHRSKLVLGFIPGDSPVAMLPLLLGLELIAFAGRAISLGLRLLINMSIGTVLTHTVFQLCGNGVLVLVGIGGFLSFEILVAYLQALIFTIILSMTVADLEANQVD